MPLKHAVCTAALAVPLLLAGAAPSAAEVDVGFGVGVGDPYYGSPSYWGRYDRYDHGLYGPGYYGPGDEVFLGAAVDVDDDDDEDVVVVEPAAAEPAPCIKTNVKNLKNACPM
jgi:hypothetical protein